MDRSWMQRNRMSEEYENGVEEFLKFAQRNLPNNNGRFDCPCVKCSNQRPLNVGEIRDHLHVNGICKGYTTWTWHGEVLDRPSVSQREKVDVDIDDRLEEMIRDIGQESFQRAHVYDTLCSDKDQPLYPGCTNFTRLSAVLRLFNLKAINGWTDKSFTELLELLKDMLPEGNTLPNRNYEAKKILCPMGVEYKKIHACRNDCILYWKENEEKEKCPKCATSRYKKKDGDDSCDASTKGPPAKVLWYLPIIPRFRRLFANGNNAKNIRWHADERKCDGKLRHPADSLQWKKIDSLFPDFGNEPRNLRLGLSTDGMNPYGSLSSNHSSWPVLLVIYNLSPWLCMKRKYIMLSMMISGPKQPGNDIDVYLSPLIEDLKILWEEGIDVFDGYSRENFKLRAMLFCTINDFPAYGNLSGYSVKGHKACPICEEDTCYHQLQHGRKTVYLGHQRFLMRNHPYRRLKKAFNGCQENGVAPKALTGEEVYQRVKNINVSFGKKQKKPTEKNIWKKLLWQDILSLFDMPDDEKLKNKWIAYAGERWRTFKTVLATTYISGDGDKDGNKTPCPKYSYIDEETWQQFVKIRESPEFQVKRQKAQQNQSHNDCPHRTSRLGYIKLKGIMKDENLKAMQEEAGDPTLIVDPPSPPRYELWKRARQKASGGYTSEASASIADKIDSLVQESQQGTFVPSGRQDILTTAIGKPEHPGRVRAAGRGVGIKKYFGGLSRPTSGAIYTEAQLQAFRQGIIEEVTQSFNKQLGKALEERMASFGFSQQDSSPKDAMRVSTKGSCSRAHDEDVPKKNVLTDLAILAMKHDKDSVKLDLEHEHHEHFFIHKTDIMHLISGDEWLGLSHLSIWCTYLHRLCITKGTGHLYEFMDPFFIASCNASENVQTYIQKKLLEEKTKDCYLLPYLSNKHWQLLIICPKSNLVVWMCSLYYKPSSSIMRIVNSAMEGYSFMRGFRQKRQPEWVTPIVPCQNDGYSCGYYVMQNMFNIISADIISSWEETFTDRKPFKKAVLVNLQEIWAQFFMTIYAEQHRKQSKPTKTNSARTQKK